MKAWQMQQSGDPWEQLQIAEVTLPSPERGSVRIRVEATDLNFADILQCQGSYQVKLEPPFTPGMNAAGTVIDAGPDSPFSPGDRIIGPSLISYGGYAQEAMIVDEQAYLLPEGVDATSVAGMYVTYGTAWFALHHRGHLEPGETILVLAGAGGVGSAAIQMARAHGAMVIAAAGGPDKLQLCRDLGADHVIDYKTENLYEAVKSITDGRGVDVVYDPVGGEYFDTARRLLAWEGRLLVVGFASGAIPQAPANHVLVKNYSVVGVHMGGYRERDPAVLRRCYAELFDQLAEGAIKPFISEVIGFDDLPAAMQRLATRQTTGRIVWDPAR